MTTATLRGLIDQVIKDCRTITWCEDKWQSELAPSASARFVRANAILNAARAARHDAALVGAEIEEVLE